MAKPKPELQILAFASLDEWEAWLAAQPADSPGVWLKLGKKSAGVPSVTMPEAIDGALCHGWIDGQIGRFDEHWYVTRFTPRRRRSLWSDVNRRNVQRLIEAGRMQPAGLSQVEAAKADGRWDAAYAPPSRAEPPEDLQRALDAEPRAKAFFETLKGANRYAVIYRVRTAKKPETRARRIAQFVAMLSEGRKIHT